MRSCCFSLARLRTRAAGGRGAGAGVATVSGDPAHSVHQAWPGALGAGVVHVSMTFCSPHKFPLQSLPWQL
eukprot:16439212-Heterocapsa_arctica.AAC.1